MKKIRKQTAGRMAALLVLAMALGGCGSKAKETEALEEESAVAVSMQSVGTGTITLTNSFVGTISPEETVMVIPLAQGTVTKTFFEVGDTVQAGDILFQIDDEAAKLTLEQAQIGMQTAQIGMQTARQSADSTRHNLAGQEDSSNLQIENSKLQAQSSYEQAQIGYVMSKDSYEELDDQYDALKEQVDAQQQYVSQNPNDVSANDILKEAAKNLSTLKSARDQAYQGYLTARSGYRTAEKGRELTDESEEITKKQLATTMEDTEASLGTALTQAEVGISQAAIGVNQAEMALSYYTVKAPVSGVIESKNVDVNGMATQASPAYTIVNNNTMTVTFQVSETVKNTLSIGQKITLERNDDTYTASITEIGASVNPQSGLFQIKACVETNGAQIPSGVSVKVNADTYRAENTLLIPYEAVYYENEGAYVYISVDGRAVKKPITTGIFDDDNIVVTDGLSLGDVLVTSWSPQLTEGVLLHDAGTKKSADAETKKPADTKEADGKEGQ